MALRVVLAVLLALALFAVAAPAVEDARTDRTATTLDAAGDRVLATADRLVATSDPAARGTAARRHLRLAVPTRGPGARAGALRLRDGRVEWRVAGGDWHARSVPRLVVPDGPLVVRETARLTLEHRRRAGRSVVVVRPAPGASEG